MWQWRYVKWFWECNMIFLLSSEEGLIAIGGREIDITNEFLDVLPALHLIQTGITSLCIPVNLLLVWVAVGIVSPKTGCWVIVMQQCDILFLVTLFWNRFLSRLRRVHWTYIKKLLTSEVVQCFTFSIHFNAMEADWNLPVIHQV